MKPAVVFLAFTASWCVPCKQFKEDFANHPAVVVVDVDQDKPATRRFRVKSMPTVIAVVDGQEVGRTVGYKGKDAMQRWMDEIAP